MTFVAAFRSPMPETAVVLPSGAAILFIPMEARTLSVFYVLWRPLTCTRKGFRRLKQCIHLCVPIHACVALVHCRHNFALDKLLEIPPAKRFSVLFSSSYPLACVHWPSKYPFLPSKLSHSHSNYLCTQVQFLFVPGADSRCHCGGLPGADGAGSVGRAGCPAAVHRASVHRAHHLSHWTAAHRGGLRILQQAVGHSLHVSTAILTLTPYGSH